MLDNTKMTRVAVAALQDKKGEDIAVLHVGSLTTICDDFLLVSGNSRSQIDALLDAVQENLGKEGVFPRNVEGSSAGGWILLDYRDLVIHIFSREMREFYDLEHTWRDSAIDRY